MGQYTHSTKKINYNFSVVPTEWYGISTIVWCAPITDIGTLETEKKKIQLVIHMVSIYLISKVNEAFHVINPGTGLRFGIQEVVLAVTK